MALLDDLSRMGRDDLRATLRGLGEWLDREHGSNVMEDSVKYTAPRVTDYGSISGHTFIHTNSQGHVVHKDHIVCETDKFGEYSCGGHGGSVGGHKR